MEKYKYDYSVYIGRFQPPHIGHLKAIHDALKISERIIIIIGSANIAPNIKNPFTDGQRAQMLLNALEPFKHRIIIRFVEDSLYQPKKWFADVQTEVIQAVSAHGWIDKPRIALVGFKKDESSWYLDSFPQWDFVESEFVPIDGDVDAAMHSTDIRELYFKGKLLYLKNVLGCDENYQFLLKQTKTEQYKTLCQEYLDSIQYEKLFSSYPNGWAVNFLCADAVVVQSGHILLVKRAQTPGKGLWALPGGHVGPNETTLEAAIRELREETRLKVPVPVLKGSIKGKKFFDHPDRSLRGRVSEKRGRTVTMAYCFALKDSEKLPKVRGSSDACEDNGGAAWWFSFGEFLKMRYKTFEDHYDIAKYFIDSME